jgi:hypothetical protein
MNALVNLFDSLFGKKKVPTPKPAPIDRRPLYKELYTQSLNNVRYIRSSLNTYNGVVNYVKGDSPAETRAKKQKMQSQIDWLKTRLAEEEFMSQHYLQLMQ